MAAAVVWVLPTIIALLLAVLVLVFLLSRRAAPPGRMFFPAPSALDVVGTAWCTGLAKDATSNSRRQTVMMIWRLLVFVWMMLVQAWLYYIDTLWINVFYFTSWNYHLQILFWGMAFFASAKLKYAGGDAGDVLSPCFRASFLVLFEVCLAMSLLVSIVVWGILAPNAIQQGHGDQFLNFWSYNQHVFNTVFMAVEFSTNRLCVHYYHVLVPLCWACLYSVFVWIQHIWSHSWPYFFMKLDVGALVWYPALMAIHISAFMCCVCASRCR